MQPPTPEALGCHTNMTNSHSFRDTLNFVLSHVKEFLPRRPGNQPNNKLGLSFPALTTTGVLYMPAPIPTSTSAQPKLGTGLPPNPSSHGVSHACNVNAHIHTTFWHNGHPIIVRDAPVSISIRVLMPSTVVGISQHPG